MLAAALAWGALPAAGFAAEDDRATALGLEAIAGVDGHVVPNTWTPVTVSLRPAEPLQGRVVLATSATGPTTVTSVDVEVGAGVQKRYHLLAPPGGSLRVQVVDEASGAVVTVRPQGDRVDGFLVGVLGGTAPDDVPAVTLPMTDQRATVVALDEDLLGLGPRGLDAVSTLVVASGDLARLPAPTRRAVVSHVAGGATLVVTGATDPDLGLPWRTATGVGDAGFEPAPGAWVLSTDVLVRDQGDPPPEQEAADVAAVAAGQGRLVTTTWSPGPGAPQEPDVWEHLLQPTTANASTQQSNQWANLPGEVEQAFGASAGEPPSLTWLAGFLLVYVLVAGPVVGVVLSRRRRPELAWVVLPVVTALFAGAAFFGASGSRPRVGVAARVATWSDGVGTSLAVAGVRSPQTGQHTLTLPGPGWQVASASWSGATRLTADDQQTTATVTLPSQAFGAVVATRPTDAPPPLDVEVAVVAGEARVEVTNTTDQPLDDLTLRLGTSTHALAPTLPAGETLVETVQLPADLPRQRDPFGGFGGPFDDRDRGPEALGMLVRWDVLTGAPGMAWVTATSPTPMGMPVPSVDGNTPLDRGTLVAVGVTPPVTDDATAVFEVQRDLVAVAGQSWRDGPLTISGPGPATMRFRLPHEGRGLTELRFDLEPPMGGGMMRPEVVPAEQCGTLETRDGETGALLSSEDMCSPGGPPCPPNAVSCGWADDGSGVLEGEVCLQDDTCRDVRWIVDDTAVQDQPPPDGLQVWDHRDRSWVDLVDVTDADGTVDAMGLPRVLGPLGQVWVRAVGELQPFDLGPQGVGAGLADRS